MVIERVFALFFIKKLKSKEFETNAEAFALKAAWSKLASQFLSITFKTVRLNIIATEPPKIH
jgi:hypothetical protein